MPLRKVTSLTLRPETGAVQFGTDWPGVYLRGKHAISFAGALDIVLNYADEYKDELWVYRQMCQDLITELRSCSV